LSGQIEVRPATERDAQGIAEAHVRAWQAAYRGLVPDRILDGLSLEGAERNWQRLVGERGAFTLVAGREGAVDGFCTVSTPSRDTDATQSTAEVAAIYVHPDRWRAGIGRALLDEALGRLREEGWRDVTLWVFGANDEARAFYATRAFQPDGAERRNEAVGQVAVRLRAALSEDVPGDEG
jgi:GNAT superfamily N-acetyltransferase